MNDEHFDKLINDARNTYRVPPTPPLEEMWAEIDAELGPIARRETFTPNRGAQWRAAGFAAAAALVLGIGVGRWSATTTTTEPVGQEVAVAPVTFDNVPARESDELAEPLQRRAANYLGETAALLTSLQSNPGASTERATRLLATTRMLLDSPAAKDARLFTLLEDLEVILAQISMLNTGGPNALRQRDVQMIRNALTEREVVPRVHTAVVTLASIDDD